MGRRNRKRSVPPTRVEGIERGAFLRKWVGGIEREESEESGVGGIQREAVGGTVGRRNRKTRCTGNG